VSARGSGGTGGSAGRGPAVRVGIGYDAHRFAEGRRLVLGGVEVPYDRGLLGHSDADVVLHAIMDALLGAAGLGDIGCHFPDTDETFRGASSVLLLAATCSLLEASGFFAAQLDATVLAEAPRLAPHVPAMRARIAEALGIDESCVSIKATTNEGLGWVGRGEGIAAFAVAQVDVIAGARPAVPRAAPARRAKAPVRSRAVRKRRPRPPAAAPRKRPPRKRPPRR